MALGGLAIVNRPLRKREAVMGAGIDLDLGLGGIVFHRLFYLLDDFDRRVNVGFRAAEIEFGLGLAPGKMRAVGLVGGQMGAVDRCGGLDAVREMRCGVDRVSSAHAVADGTDNF